MDFTVATDSNVERVLTVKYAIGLGLRERDTDIGGKPTGADVVEHHLVADVADQQAGAVQVECGRATGRRRRVGGAVR